VQCSAQSAGGDLTYELRGSGGLGLRMHGNCGPTPQQRRAGGRAGGRASATVVQQADLLRRGGGIDAEVHGQPKRVGEVSDAHKLPLLRRDFHRLDL
jgi:hypothetical protein